MNNLYVSIKQAQKQYRMAAIKEKNRKAKVKASSLTVLLGELQTKFGDNATDADVISMAKKHIDKLDEQFSYSGNDDFMVEKEALSVYMPSQLTENQLKAEIGKIADSLGENVNMGAIMKVLKTKFQGRYDGSMASKMAREVIK